MNALITEKINELAIKKRAKYVSTPEEIEGLVVEKAMLLNEEMQLHFSSGAWTSLIYNELSGNIEFSDIPGVVSARTLHKLGEISAEDVQEMHSERRASSKMPRLGGS